MLISSLARSLPFFASLSGGHSSYCQARSQQNTTTFRCLDLSYSHSSCPEPLLDSRGQMKRIQKDPDAVTSLPKKSGRGSDSDPNFLGQISFVPGRESPPSIAGRAQASSLGGRKEGKKSEVIKSIHSSRTPVQQRQAQVQQRWLLRLSCPAPIDGGCGAISRPNLGSSLLPSFPLSFLQRGVQQLQPRGRSDHWG